MFYITFSFSLFKNSYPIYLGPILKKKDQKPTLSTV